jgi:hypothetical protein
MPGAMPLDDGFVTGVRATARAVGRGRRRAVLARFEVGRVRAIVFVVFFLVAICREERP